MSVNRKRIHKKSYGFIRCNFSLTCVFCNPQSPESQMNEATKTMEGIVSAGPVNLPNLTIAVDIVDKVLKLEKEFELPSSLLQELDLVLERTHLPKEQVHFTVKTPNVAVMVAASTKDISIIGIKVKTSSQDFKDSSMHLLTPGTTINIIYQLILAFI